MSAESQLEMGDSAEYSSIMGDLKEVSVMGRIVVGDKKYPTTFKAAIWVPGKDLSVLTRKVLDELKYEFVRKTSSKNFSKFVFVLSIPKFSYVFEFRVKQPVEFCIKAYDQKLTPSADVHFLEIEELTKENLPHVKRFITCLADKLPRKPWKFSFGDRFRYGFAAPEYVTAKRKWKLMGVK